MAPRPYVIPPTRCAAHSRRTKQPCRKWAVPGGKVCHLHGGAAPQVRVNAGVERTLAEVMASGTRSPWDTLRRAREIADAVMEMHFGRVEHQRPVPVDQGVRLMDAAKVAHDLAKRELDAGVDERLTRQVELEGRVVAAVLGVLLDALVDALLPVAPDVQALRAWALECAEAALLAVEADEPRLRVELPPPPLRLGPASSISASSSAVGDAPTAGYRPAADADPRVEEPAATRGALAAD